MFLVAKIPCSQLCPLSTTVMLLINTCLQTVAFLHTWPGVVGKNDLGWSWSVYGPETMIKRNPFTFWKPWTSYFKHLYLNGMFLSVDLRTEKESSFMRIFILIMNRNDSYTSSKIYGCRHILDLPIISHWLRVSCSHKKWVQEKRFQITHTTFSVLMYKLI